MEYVIMVFAIIISIYEIFMYIRGGTDGKIAYLCLFAVLLFMFIQPVRSIYAAEATQETNSGEAATDPEELDVDAESISLVEFGYLSAPDEDAAVTLVRIYNLLLTLFYFIIIYVGYKVIMRNIRKGRVRNGIAD